MQKYEADAGDILHKQDVEDRINLNKDQHKDGYITLCYFLEVITIRMGKLNLL